MKCNQELNHYQTDCTADFKILLNYLCKGLWA